MSDKFRDFPLDAVVAQAGQRVNELRANGSRASVHQKWTCRHCGSRQTMAEANAFHRSGRCEACDGVTILDKCNYVLFIGGA